MLVADPRFARLDSMTGTEFEEALVELFGLLGYDEVRRIGGFDKGADIIFTREGKRVAVQAKRSASAVPIGAVRQLIDGMRRYECEQGLVVTNAFFSEPAVECAAIWNIELWDRRMLAGYLNGEPPTLDTSICAECGTRVAEGVRQWCADHPARFGGNIYCRRHQSRRRRSSDSDGRSSHQGRS